MVMDSNHSRIIDSEFFFIPVELLGLNAQAHHGSEHMLPTQTRRAVLRSVEFRKVEGPSIVRRGVLLCPCAKAIEYLGANTDGRYSIDR